MIILCVTGSVAASQAVKLAREFKRQGMEVKCFMSEAACKILHPNSMEFATGSEVITELTGNIEHVKYSQEDLILVAPATANTISKFAYKIADNPISTLLITAYGHDTPIYLYRQCMIQCLRLLKKTLIKSKPKNLLFSCLRLWMREKQNFLQMRTLFLNL
jgi:phosphopantothenoylcysteine decarboxylase/phosphopantothenate--cysteine ligase